MKISNLEFIKHSHKVVECIANWKFCTTSIDSYNNHYYVIIYSTRDENGVYSTPRISKNLRSILCTTTSKDIYLDRDWRKNATE